MRRMTMDEIPRAARYVARKRRERYDRVTFHLMAGTLLAMATFLGWLAS